MRDKVCKGCGRPLDKPVRLAIGRRYSRRYGWHNATTLACPNCNTWLRWHYQPHGYDDSDGVMRIPRNVDELQEYAAACGSHFFDADTMRFFKSRVLDGVTIHDGRVYFVTSERNSGFGGDYSRRYTARVMCAGAHIDAIRGFQEYATAREARAAIAEATA